MTLHSIIIQKLLSTNAHLGRRVAAHHFKQYTFGFRNGMAIIDSDKTLICLRNACHFISLLARQRAAFMFVNTNPLFDEIIRQMTQKIGCYNPNMNALSRMGGFLTNSSSPKKFRSRNKKIRFAPSQLPDCVVVFDTERKSSVVMEAAKLQVPVVALVGSSMPWEIYSKITYPMPGNDSVQFVYLLCNMITKTFLVEQKKLGLLNDDGDRWEQIDSKKGNGEKVQQIEGETEIDAETEIDSETKIDTETEIDSEDNLLVVPYDSLAPISEDIAETKMLLDKLVVVKFNGAIGTNMGSSDLKSAIKVNNKSTLLDLMIDQVETLNSKYGCNVPLLLMDTAETHNHTQKVLEKYSTSKIDIHSIKLSQQAQEKSVEGQSGRYPSSDHRSVFLSLMKSGTLDVLLLQGKDYALVVDSENAAVVADPKIFNHLVENQIEYCMEVAAIPSIQQGTGTINLQPRPFRLMDITQNPDKQCGENFKFKDTKSMWVNLSAFKRLIDTDALNVENLSSSKENGDQIILQGTAADSAIRFFDRTIGINVPPSHYLPVNSTSDLLLLKSDLYSSAEGILVRNPARDNPLNPSIKLGPEFEKVDNFQSRFKSMPSIVNLESLNVEGDVWLGAGITLKGRVSIVAKPGVKLEIPDGIVLENKEITDVADIQE